MEQDIKNIFEEKLGEKLGGKYTLCWDIDNKGVVCGWCKLYDADDIIKAAEAVKKFSGRLMTISPLIKPDSEEKQVEINYHFYFDKINFTISVTLPGDHREVKSITPILKSADWHEREMQDFYNIKLVNHPNPKRLFLDKSIEMKDDTMIPLSQAMNSLSTNTLWEKVMKAGRGEDDENE